MKSLLALPLIALAACTAYAPPDPVQVAAADEAIDAKVDRALAGRVPGPTVSCIRTRDVDSSTPLTSDLILFKTRGNLVYLNQGRGACNFNPSSAYRRHTTSPSMCAGEILDVYDPRSGVPRGSCGLGEFTPYRRAS